MKKNIIIMFLIMVFFNLREVFADLPVHCDITDVIGIWNIETTSFYELSNYRELKCGFPSITNSDIVNKISNITQEYTNKFSLTLYSDYSAILKDQLRNYKGKWSMIYNQGFIAKFLDYNFVAFFQYSLESSLKDRFFIRKSNCSNVMYFLVGYLKLFMYKINYLRINYQK